MGLSVRPNTVQPSVRPAKRDALADVFEQRRVTHDAALADLALADLELAA
jgi:hypothetical protein